MEIKVYIHRRLLYRGTPVSLAYSSSDASKMCSMCSIFPACKVKVDATSSADDVRASSLFGCTCTVKISVSYFYDDVVH